MSQYIKSGTQADGPGAKYFTRPIFAKWFQGLKSGDTTMYEYAASYLRYVLASLNHFLLSGFASLSIFLFSHPHFHSQMFLMTSHFFPFFFILCRILSIYVFTIIFIILSFLLARLAVTMLHGVHNSQMQFL